jgi:hypothetical protein
MNKYLLPIVIIAGLIIIVGYSQLSKSSRPTTKESVLTITPAITQPVENISISTTSTSSSVPLPTSEDIIRTFFSLINEKRIPEAIGMMTAGMVGDESGKQAWGVHFNNIDSIVLKKIEPTLKEEWTQSEQEYRVLLDVRMNPKSADASIPYYGWDNGENIRWVMIQKEGNLWKISSLPTGP